jgi:hypothetical protein
VREFDAVAASLLPSARTVRAAQRGDRQALTDLASGCLPLLYNIVGRALNGHPDVDDVVQERPPAGRTGLLPQGGRHLVVPGGEPGPQGVRRLLVLRLDGGQRGDHPTERRGAALARPTSTPRSAVAQLRRYVQAVYARYHRPIWLTEYALIRFGKTCTYPSGPQQATFVKASATMLAHLRGVERYAWFALPATKGSGTGLFTESGTPTIAGTAFERLPAR